MQQPVQQPEWRQGQGAATGTNRWKEVKEGFAEYSFRQARETADN